MIYEAAVRIRIKATTKDEAEERIKRVLEWIGFGCDVIMVVPTADEET